MFLIQQVGLCGHPISQRMDSVKQWIMKELPELPVTGVAAVMSRLDELGVESKHDLCYVKEWDLAGVISSLQIHKLLKACKHDSQRSDKND